MTGWWILASGYVLLATATGAAAFSKHTAYPLILTMVYAAVSVAMLTALARTALFLDGGARHRQRVVAMALALCAGLALVNVVLYPRTRVAAAHSSAPDALIDSASRLIAGTYPYARPLYDGALISPGPGWIALHAPLTTTGLIWLMVPVHAALAALTISIYTAPAAIVFVLFMFSLPAFLQMSIVGHDLFAVGCAMAVVTLGVHGQITSDGRGVVPWAIAAAIVASARVPFAILVVALGLLAVAQDRRKGLTFVLVASAALVALHLGFYAWGRSLGLFYHPLHVFGRANGGAGRIVLALGAVVALTAAVWLWQRGTRTAADWLFFTWAAVGLPFVAVGFGELISVNQMDWSHWEGKVYTGYSLPLLIAGLLLERPSKPRTVLSHTL